MCVQTSLEYRSIDLQYFKKKIYIKVNLARAIENSNLFAYGAYMFSYMLIDLQ